MQFLWVKALVPCPVGSQSRAGDLRRLWNARPGFRPAEERNPDEPAHPQGVFAHGPDLSLVVLAVLRIDHVPVNPVISLYLEVAQDDHAEDGLVLEFSRALVAEVLRGSAGADLGYLAKELIADEVGVYLAAGGAVAVDHLPVADGVLELGGELLGGEGGGAKQKQEDCWKGTEPFETSGFHGVTPWAGL